MNQKVGNNWLIEMLNEENDLTLSDLLISIISILPYWKLRKRHKIIKEIGETLFRTSSYNVL